MALHVRGRLRRTLNAQPELLLEHDRGPVGVKGDLFFADLIGHDEQIDHEWTIPDVRSELYVPINERVSVAIPKGDALMWPQPRRATYVLQSNYAKVDVADEVAFSVGWDICGGPPRFLATVVLLRYKRRA